eukprot:jgi/Bigna1/62252/fgenesh1_kg.32_\
MQKYNQKKQHPMYRTSSNDYGARSQTTEEAPKQYHGLKGNFTKEFSGGFCNSQGLVTSTTKHRVKKTPEMGVN